MSRSCRVGSVGVGAGADHRQSSAVDKAADAAVKLNVVQIELRSSDLKRDEYEREKHAVEFERDVPR